MAIRLHPSVAVHAGVWLRQVIVQPAGLNFTEAAARLHVTRESMSKLLNGNAGLSAEMAIRFERAFGEGGGWRAQTERSDSARSVDRIC